MASQIEVINQDRRYTYKRNIGARSRNHSCRGKAISITYSECICSISYPACSTHAPYYIVIGGLSGLLHFPTISHKLHDYNYENNQQDALYRLIYYSKSALHFSGDVFAHRQEHLTRYCKYSQVLLTMGENIARNM